MWHGKCLLFLNDCIGVWCVYYLLLEINEKLYTKIKGNFLTEKKSTQCPRNEIKKNRFCGNSMDFVIEKMMHAVISDRKVILFIFKVI